MENITDDLLVDYLPLQLELITAEAVEIFNEKPNALRKFLVDKRIITGTANEVAKFIFHQKKLSKRRIGEYVGSCDDFNQEVCDILFSFYKLVGLMVDEAIRYLARHLRLPGEAQQIDRILEKFAANYFKQNPSFSLSADVLYILFFSLIMLNTDLHNPSIAKRKKMKPAQFVNNLKGINNGQDISRELLLSLYRRIQKSAICMDDSDMFESKCLEFIAPTKSGWMEKQRHGFPRYWSRRWFILKDGCLYYFSTPMDDHPRGVIPLLGTQVRLVRGATSNREHIVICSQDRQEVKVAKRSRAKPTSKSYGVRLQHRDAVVLRCDADEVDPWLTYLVEECELLSSSALVQQLVPKGGGLGDYTLKSEKAVHEEGPMGQPVHSEGMHEAAQVPSSASISSKYLVDDCSSTSIMGSDDNSNSAASAVGASSKGRIRSLSLTAARHPPLHQVAPIDSKVTSPAGKGLLKPSSFYAVSTSTSASISASISEKDGSGKIAAVTGIAGLGSPLPEGRRMSTGNIDGKLSHRQRASFSAFSNVNFSKSDDPGLVSAAVSHARSTESQSSSATLSMDDSDPTNACFFSPRQVGLLKMINLHSFSSSAATTTSLLTNRQMSIDPQDLSVHLELPVPIVQGWLASKSSKHDPDHWRSRYFVLFSNADNEGPTLFWYSTREAADEMQTRGVQTQQGYIRIKHITRLCAIDGHPSGDAQVEGGQQELASDMAQPSRLESTCAGQLTPISEAASSQCASDCTPVEQSAGAVLSDPVIDGISPMREVRVRRSAQYSMEEDEDDEDDHMQKEMKELKENGWVTPGLKSVNRSLFDEEGEGGDEEGPSRSESGTQELADRMGRASVLVSIFDLDLGDSRAASQSCLPYDYVPLAVGNQSYCQPVTGGLVRTTASAPPIACVPICTATDGPGNSEGEHEDQEDSDVVQIRSVDQTIWIRDLAEDELITLASGGAAASGASASASVGAVQPVAAWLLCLRRLVNPSALVY